MDPASGELGTGRALGDRLTRRLSLGDAVVLGLGSMIGAGVFVAFGPAAQAAGSGLVLGLVLAAVVALCNALSSAQLAAMYPSSGGTYVYGRERLGPLWGYLAGWGFVVGKAASCAAMALTFGAYTSERFERPLAVGAVIALTALNLGGVHKTAALTRVIVAGVVVSLAVVVVAALGGGSLDAGRLGSPLDTGGWLGIAQSAAVLFFAFAGYARIATLGEEVLDPARTIPRAILVALAIALALYLVVAVSSVVAVGPGVLAASDAPLVAVVEHGRWRPLMPVVRFGAALGALGVLLSLLVGVSRTAFAMARNGEFARALAVVDQRSSVPYRAELAVGLVVAATVVVADLRGAIGFSAFCVLLYYAIANAAAFTLTPQERRWPRAVCVAGFVGCICLAFALPRSSVVAGVAVLAVGVVVRGLRRPGQATSA